MKRFVAWWQRRRRRARAQRIARWVRQHTDHELAPWQVDLIEGMLAR